MGTAGSIRNRGNTPGNIVVANDELARVDHNGRFELSGLQYGGSYDLEVLGSDVASREVYASG